MGALKFFALFAIISLAACQTTKGGSFCQVAQPIRLSPSAIDALTDDQVRDLLAHNRKGQRLCQWRP